MLHNAPRIHNRIAIMPILSMISLFIVLLAAAAYLLFKNGQQKRLEQRQRLLTALKARRNLFKDLITRFPEGFLSKELSVFLLRALRDTLEQLQQLEPKTSGLPDELASTISLLTHVTNNPPSARVRLTNLEQIKEARKLLQELHRFISLQEQTQQISHQDASLHKDLIKRLALQIAVDGHTLGAKAALSQGKIKLAIHHYTLALKLLTSENASKIFDQQILQLSQHIEKLRESLAPQPELDPAPESRDWSKFEAESDTWKKKNLYD